MSKSIKSVTLETAFGDYVIDTNGVLGEGGAGRVYGGFGPDRSQIAVKVLFNATSDKRRRFKNEIAFLRGNKHPNIVTVIDDGFVREGKIVGPFYVMPRYSSSLRTLMQKGIPSNDVLPLFLKILDGVEAAHFPGVVHRDLKPENILYDTGSHSPVVADFGVAHFTEDFLVTAVETSPNQRLANFLYAAPEQRRPGQTVGKAADIFALGLILNEVFTGNVPHGTDFPLIKDTASQFGYLDEVVGQMLKQNQNERPVSIDQVKSLIQKYHSELIIRQRLSSISGAVIKTEEIDEPSASSPPKLIDYDWDGRILKLILDRTVSQDWVSALKSLGSFTAVRGKPPALFSFSENVATIGAEDHEIQSVINYFKQWLPAASAALKYSLEQKALRSAADMAQRLRKERELEERRLRVLQTVRI
jgi:serine/threonine protein kinase